MKPRCSAFLLVTPKQGKGQWKWYKMIEVNGAYKHGRYEKRWLKSLCAMSNVKVFATQDNPPADPTNTTHYTDPHVTHMDQKEKKRELISAYADLNDAYIKENTHFSDSPAHTLWECHSVQQVDPTQARSEQSLGTRPPGNPLLMALDTHLIFRWLESTSLLRCIIKRLTLTTSCL